MQRRSVLSGLAALAALPSLLYAADTNSTILDAKTIKAGLQTAKIEEGDFVERVVSLARKGTIPPWLVESTFEWARKKPEWRFQYFKRGLILRANKLGISLDSLKESAAKSHSHKKA